MFRKVYLSNFAEGLDSAAGNDGKDVLRITIPST